MRYAGFKASIRPSLDRDGPAPLSRTTKPLDCLNPLPRRFTERTYRPPGKQVRH